MSRYKLLLLDDEIDILKAYGEILVNNGYEVFLATTYLEAVTLVEQNDFDVVILDIFLKGCKETGLDVALLAKEKCSSTQAVIFTGKPDADTMAISTQLEVYEYLLKPVTSETMIKSVKRAIDVKELMDEKIKIKSELEKTLEIQKHILHNGDQKFTTMLEAMLATDKKLEIKIIESRNELMATIKALNLN